MPDNTAVQSFDPRSLNDQIRDRIRASVVELIPEEAWRDYIDREIADFFTDRPAGSGLYGKPGKRAPFAEVCADVMQDVAKTKLHEELNKPEWTAFWENGQQRVGVHVTAALKEHGAGLFEAMVANTVQQIVDSLRLRV
jgi:hypothetical protein